MVRDHDFFEEQQMNEPFLKFWIATILACCCQALHSGQAVPNWALDCYHPQR